MASPASTRPPPSAALAHPGPGPVAARVIVDDLRLARAATVQRERGDEPRAVLAHLAVERARPRGGRARHNAERGAYFRPARVQHDFVQQFKPAGVHLRDEQPALGSGVHQRGLRREHRGFRFVQEAHALVNRAVVPVVIQHGDEVPRARRVAADREGASRGLVRSRERPRLERRLHLAQDGLELVVAAQVHERLDVQPPQNQRRVRLGGLAGGRGAERAPRLDRAGRIREVAEVLHPCRDRKPKTRGRGRRPRGRARSRAAPDVTSPLARRPSRARPRRARRPPRHRRHRAVHSDRIGRQARRCHPIDEDVGTTYVFGVIFRSSTKCRTT